MDIEFKGWMIAIVFILFLIPILKRIMYFPYVYFHEFGHSIMGLVLGLRRDKMEFSLSEGSGQVMFNFRNNSKVTFFLVMIIGYIFPVIVVYLGIWSIITGNTGKFFIGFMVAVAYGVLNTKSFLGWVIISVGVYIGGRAMYYGEMSGELMETITYIIVWVVGIGCIFTIKTLIINYRYLPRGDNGDSSMLSKYIGMPVGFWMVIFVMVNVYAGVMLYGLTTGEMIVGMGETVIRLGK